MTTDSVDPAGIYFGTRSGQLYGSTDEGRTWKKLDGLPPVVCVKSAAVGERKLSRPRELRQTAVRRRKPAPGKSRVRRKR